MLWQPTRGILQPNQHWRRPQGGAFSPLDLDPALWLKLNDGSGTTPQDSSGNGRHGTFVNTPSYVGSELDFTAADRDAVQVAGLLGSPPAVTLAAWIDFDANDSGGSEIISISDSVLIRLNSGGANDISGIYYHGGFGFLTHAIALAGVGAAHVAYVCDPANSRQELYVNGVSVTSGSVGTAISYTQGDGNTRLGRHSSDDTFDYDGRMHDVLVFPSGLSTEQIAAVMAATS